MARAASMTLIFAVLAAAPAGAESPWVPEEGRLDLSTFTAYQDFEYFYRKGERMKFPFKRMKQITSSVRAEYGVTDHISVDVTLGYTRTDSKAFGTVDGLDDTYLGVTWQFLDEFAWEQAWMPSASVRFGGIIEGSYDARQFPAAPGDGASGFEVGLAAGKVLPYGLGLATSASFRDRSEGVPSDWHARAEVFYTFRNWLSVNVALDERRSIDGFDLGDAGFDPTRHAPRLDEDSRNVDVGLGVTDRAGRHWGLYYSRTLEGRNTGIKEIAGVQLTIPIHLPWRNRDVASASPRRLEVAGQAP